MVMEDGNLKGMEAGVPGEVVVKPVAEELEREVVLTQNHLTLQKELNVMDRYGVCVTQTNVLPRKLMEAGVPGEVVVKPVVKDIERELVLTQNHLPIQKELNVMDRHWIYVTQTNVLPRKLMEAGVHGEVVVQPVVKDIEREVVLTQNHLPIQKELNVMDG